MLSSINLIVSPRGVYTWQHCQGEGQLNLPLTQPRGLKIPLIPRIHYLIYATRGVQRTVILQNVRTRALLNYNSADVLLSKYIHLSMYIKLHYKICGTFLSGGICKD